MLHFTPDMGCCLHVRSLLLYFYFWQKSMLMFLVLSLLSPLCQPRYTVVEQPKRAITTAKWVLETASFSAW